MQDRREEQILEFGSDQRADCRLDIGGCGAADNACFSRSGEMICPKDSEAFAQGRLGSDPAVEVLAHPSGLRDAGLLIDDAAHFFRGKCFGGAAVLASDLILLDPLGDS